MPSEDRRLHPSSILFGLLGPLRGFAVPGVLFLIGIGGMGASWGWQLWALPFLIPSLVLSSLRYFSFRYRYEENEMVIRTGFLFRNERHVPYARIQNVDGVQNVLHRLANVIDVRVETGGGQEPEAKMSVLPVADFEEMRRRVFEEKGQVVATEAGLPAIAPPAERTLLQLSPSELLLHGFLQNRGFVLVTAAVGVFWEMGVMNRFGNGFWGNWGNWEIWEKGLVRGVLRDLASSILNRASVVIPWGRIGLVVAGLAALLVLVRLVSMVWALVRLHGFRLTRVGGDLRSEYGLLTRVTATIPLRRIQTVTVHEGPLQRLCGRVSVKVQTAGGAGGTGDEDGEEKNAQKQREWLAPILHKDALPGLLREILPGTDLAAVDWQAAHPRAFRRELKSSAIVYSLCALPFVVLLKWWEFGLLAAVLAFAALSSWLYVRHLGWATTDRAVLLRTGWAWRQVSVAPFAKIQAVAIHESPFDRRAAMARVRVDTAGGSEGSRRVDIPYLSRETARDLYDRLAIQAARTAFRW